MENGSKYSPIDPVRDSRNGRTDDESVDTGLQTRRRESAEDISHIQKVTRAIGGFALKFTTLKNKYLGKEEVVDLSDRLLIYGERSDSDVTSEEVLDLTNEGPLASLEAVVDGMENRGFAKDAPRIKEQVKDTSRKNKITYIQAMYSKRGKDARPIELTNEVEEHDALGQLIDFLQKVESKTEDEYYRGVARSMTENLTFIGEKEYKEAVLGIASMWKQYLNVDPNRQLCVITEISKQAGQVKSDKFLLDSILAHFDDNELEFYKGRLLIDPSDLTADPEDARLVMLDDWIISGMQMRDAYDGIRNNVHIKPYLDSLEINLIVTSDPRIENGLNVGRSWTDEDIRVPVKGYFKAHTASTSEKDHEAHVTGFHSSVDFDFELTFIEPMAEELVAQLPPPANIARPYRQSTLPNITRLTQRSDVMNKKRLAV